MLPETLMRSLLILITRSGNYIRSEVPRSFRTGIQ
jgi:hypothetical protein